MAIQLSNKNDVEPPAALSSNGIYCKIPATLALAALTTLSFAQNGIEDHARSPSHRSQSGTLPSARSHPAATHSPAAPPPPTASPMSGNTIRTHPGSQLHSPAIPQHTIGGSSFHGSVDHPSPGEHGSLSSRPFSSGHQVHETTRATPGHGTLHAVRYGHAVTGVVEHPIKSGYLSRTYVQGGRVLYARVYRQNTFQRFGHAFSYERLVPAIGFGTAYYTWAARPWATPVNYRWQWDAEPWHRAYGGDFTPYPSYTSLDEWLTDYVIAQSLKNAYESWQAENASESQPVTGGTSPATGERPYWESSSDADRRPYWEEPDDGRQPYWEEPTAKDTQAPPKSPKTHNSAPHPRTGPQNRPPAEDSPPALSGDIKAELNAQIKQQLVERQGGATASDTEDLPDSLKPGHILFRVNTPLDVPSNGSGQYCSLKANDYIARTGEMDENGMVPVKVKLGGKSDCAIGLATNVSVNDLEAMESEQQQALTDALLAASKNMGGGGLPQAPATTPMLLAAGQTSPAPDATTTLSQLR